MTNIMTAKTTTGAGDWRARNELDSGNGLISFHAIVSGTGVVSATVDIEVSNDATNAAGTPSATITLSGATTDSDIHQTNASHRYWRANVTAISGTDAAVTVIANGAISNV